MISIYRDLSRKLYKMWKSELGFSFSERKGGKIVEEKERENKKFSSPFF